MLNTGFNIRKIEEVEIQVPANSTKNEFYFPDLPDLRNVRLLNFVSYSSLTFPVTPTNRPLLNPSAYQTGFLTLVDYKGYKFVQDVPLRLFSPIIGADSANLWGALFSGQIVNWPKSYVKLPDPAQFTPGTTEFIMFTVGYELPDQFK